MEGTRRIGRLWLFAATFPAISLVGIGCSREPSDVLHLDVNQSGSVGRAAASSTISSERLSELQAVFVETRCYSVGDLLHRWRVFGALEDPAATKLLTAELPLVCDHAAFSEAFPKALPLFVETSTGYRTRLRLPSDPRNSVEGESHEFQLLCCFAEAGVGCNHLINISHSQRITVMDLLQEAQRDWNQVNDPSWLLVASCRFAPDAPNWVNRFGEATGLEEMALQLIKQPVGRGACYGTHVPYALAEFLNTYRERAAPEVPAVIVVQVRTHLTELCEKLIVSQRANGAWGKDWAGPSLAVIELKSSIPAESINSLV